MSHEPIDASQLVKSWMHSHEEDTDTTSVYRPAGYPLPPSRGRKAFDLRPGGDMIARRPGPTDRVEAADGVWQLDGRNLRVSLAGGESQTMRIVSVAPDRLVLRKST